ncbi:hypothetical protein [Comamonas sp. JNW]|uniref:hypothetical protein n=1 Tax=Comamonas sp. JNW TaxID=2170731 RepID=UPI0010577C94|nr:hypothetical protein [Comamonas sp. JNW]
MQQLEIAKGRLFDIDSLGVTNLKLFPGTNRDASPELFAEQINKSLSQIENGDFDLVDSEY